MSASLTPASTGPARAGPSTRAQRNPIVQVLVPVIAALLPVLTVPGLAFPAVTPRMSLLLLVLPLGIALLAYQSDERDRPAIVASAYLLWALAITVASAGFWWLRGVAGREYSAIALLGMFAVWAIARQADERRRVLAVWAFIGGVAVSCVAAVVQLLYAPTQGIWALIGGRVQGLTPNPVFFASCAAAAAILVAGQQNRHVWLGPSLIASFSFMVNAAGSRIVLAAYVVGLGVTGVRTAAMPRSHLIGAAVVGMVASESFISASETSTSAFDRLGSGRLDGRLTVWWYDVSAVVTRPWGWGIGRHREAIQSDFSAEFLRQHAPDQVATSWRDPHNLVLHQAVEVGVVGLVLLLIWFWYATRHARGPAAIASCVVAVVFMVEPVSLVTGPIFMLLLGLAERQRTSRRPAVDLSSRTTMALLGVGILLSSLTLIGDIRWKQATESRNPARMASAAAWYPEDPYIAATVAANWGAAAAGSGHPELWRRALEWAEVATEREPESTYWLLTYAQLHVSTGNLRAALEIVEQVLELQPNHPHALGLQERLVEAMQSQI